MATEINHKDNWNGEYRNVRFEVVKWRLGGNSEGSFPCWNYYLYLPIEQIPEEYHKYFFLKGEYRKLSPDGQDHLMYDYSGASYISDLDWHGGLTLYEKQQDGENKIIGVKLGCDYAHHFDEQAGYPYTIEYVLMETEQTIDKLHELIPNLRVSCRWNGKYYDKRECEELPQGGYLANENKEAWYKVR
jgi:hypothetical protein